MNPFGSTLIRGLLATALLACISGTALARDPAQDKCVGKVPLPPGDGSDLLVEGDCVVKAGTYNYGVVTIFAQKSLTFEDANIDFTAKSIIVLGGTLNVGTAAAPVGTANKDNRVVLRLIGDKPAVAFNLSEAAAHNHPLMEAKQVNADTCSTIDKGISVAAGGKILLYGARGVASADRDSSGIGGPNPGSVSWTYLAKPAGPSQYQTSTARIGAPVDKDGEKKVFVPLDVSKDWRPGDWIVVGTTSFSPFESEFVKIAADSDAVTFAGGITTIKLDATTPLRQYHFGGSDPGRPSSANFSSDATTNYGVDERAEVGLITRSVTLTSKMPNWETQNPTEEKSLNWGGEIKVCSGFGEVKVQGVELDRFGKDQLGSYPFHLHMVGTVKPGTLLVNSNSIHHSYNHCIVVHQTNDAKFSNNVCARIIGHIFYQEKMADAISKPVELTGLKFNDNLGLGAMANGFGISASVPRVDVGGKQVPKNYFEGDYFARTGDGYYGLFIPNTDDKSLAVRGSCFEKLANGQLNDPVPPTGSPPVCPANRPYYFEPPTGFWIVNPATEMIGNSIGGCQSLGKGFWYVPPNTTTADREQLKFQPVGRFINNRAHGCYDGVFGETDTGVSSEQLFPKVGGNLVNKNLIARFDAFTAFRIRNRGIWMRPTWFVFDNTRVATTRDAVSLVTSGGSDGNAPGVWGLLKSSIVVGVSKNNVDRWGPCGDRNLQEGPGCVDWNSEAAVIFEKGYPSPAWNFAGFYIYDGPARLHDIRFVNFHVDPRKDLLTNDDVTIQNAFNQYYNGAKRYEGDAALGWFQNNQSAYPVATESRGLRWDSVDLRHQVFTEKVNFGNFDDGDKNTAIIDRDGTLTGFKVVTGSGAPAHEQYPISLNNLPINAASNAVDECNAQGAQDTDYENRPTSLISPANYGTLELEAFTLPNGVVPAPPPPMQTGTPLTQLVTFAKDTVDYGTHSTMTLHSRNNQGIWEPKVVSGLGYTVTAAKATDPKYAKVAREPGFPRYISVGLTDVVKPGIKKGNEFYTRVGVCYTNKDGSHPDGNFEIKRGYRSWGGNGVELNDPDMRKKFVFLNLVYEGQRCFNLASQTPDIMNNASIGCGAAYGVFGRDSNDSCPDGGDATLDQNKLPICAYKPTLLGEAKTLPELTRPDGTPADLNKWYYDKTTGMLFFYVMQDRANARGSTPLGSCTGGANDSACPNPDDATYPENYYTCPPEGCVNYAVRLSANTPYDPGESACTVKGDPQSIYKANPDYVQPKQSGVNQLAFVVPGGTTPPPPFKDGDVVDAHDVDNPPFPHRIPYFGGSPVSPVCPGVPAGGSFNALNVTR